MTNVHVYGGQGHTRRSERELLLLRGVIRVDESFRCLFLESEKWMQRWIFMLFFGYGAS